MQRPFGLGGWFCAPGHQAQAMHGAAGQKRARHAQGSSWAGLHRQRKAGATPRGSSRAPVALPPRGGQGAGCRHRRGRELRDGHGRFARQRLDEQPAAKPGTVEPNARPPMAWARDVRSVKIPQLLLALLIRSCGLPIHATCRTATRRSRTADPPSSPPGAIRTFIACGLRAAELSGGFDPERWPPPWADFAVCWRSELFGESVEPPTWHMADDTATAEC